MSPQETSESSSASSRQGYRSGVPEKQGHGLGRSLRLVGQRIVTLFATGPATKIAKILLTAFDAV
jgi:hypothetical protein